MEDNLPITASSKQPLTDELVLAAIERMSIGESIRDSCKSLKLAESAVRMRIIRSNSLGEAYARARENYADILVDRLMDIAKDQDDPQRARLMCDNVKWCAAKILPKKFGDRTQTVVTGPNDGPLQVQYETSEEAKRALADLTARIAVLNGSD